MKNQVNLEKFSKPGLIFKNHNSWNLRLRLKAQSSINLIWMIELKKNSNKKNLDQTWKKIRMESQETNKIYKSSQTKKYQKNGD
jgi:hypothetical protein